MVKPVASFSSGEEKRFDTSYPYKVGVVPLRKRERPPFLHRLPSLTQEQDGPSWLPFMVYEKRRNTLFFTSRIKSIPFYLIFRKI